MELSMSGWSLAACIWGIVVVLAYLLKISKQWVQAYRIRRGRMQMNAWLEYLGKHFDAAYKEGTPYSKNAMKTWVAKVSVEYFKQVQNRSRE